MSGHTPTPWELIEATEHHGAYIVNSWGRTVCDLYAMSNPMAASIRNGGTSAPVPFDDMAANAAFIVRAVNNFDALVKALEKAVAHLNAIEGFCCDPKRPCGDYDAECPIGMGEWFSKDDRAELTWIRETLATAGAKK